MVSTLLGKNIALLTDHGFEEVELSIPKRALEDAGAVVHIISLQKEVKAWNHDNWSIVLTVDCNLLKTSADEYDALLIPGGVINPDQMRRHSEYISFAHSFLESGKPIAAICHAPQLLIETGLLKGRRLTSFSSIKTDLINAGALWEDAEVICDINLITSRSPKDLPAFNTKMIDAFSKSLIETGF